jgi:hypothetical protein
MKRPTLPLIRQCAPAVFKAAPPGPMPLHVDDTSRPLETHHGTGAEVDLLQRALAESERIAEVAR